MELYIDVQTSVYQVQHAFNLCYPYLRLEFFVEVPAAFGDEGSPLRRRRIPGESGFPFPHAKSPIHINIDGSRTVRQVAAEFREKFQVIASVSRLSGNVWVNTVLTESWTLFRQNEEGEQLNRMNGGEPG